MAVKAEAAPAWHFIVPLRGRTLRFFFAQILPPEAVLGIR